MLTDEEKLALLGKCNEVFREFLERIREIEEEQNVYIQFEFEDVSVTPFGSLFEKYEHDVRVKRIIIQ